MWSLFKNKTVEDKPDLIELLKKIESKFSFFETNLKRMSRRERRNLDKEIKKLVKKYNEYVGYRAL